MNILRGLLCLVLTPVAMIAFLLMWIAICVFMFAGKANILVKIREEIIT